MMPPVTSCNRSRERVAHPIEVRRIPCAHNSAVWRGTARFYDRRSFIVPLLFPNLHTAKSRPLASVRRPVGRRMLGPTRLVRGTADGVALGLVDGAFVGDHQALDGDRLEALDELLDALGRAGLAVVRPDG